MDDQSTPKHVSQVRPFIALLLENDDSKYLFNPLRLHPVYNNEHLHFPDNTCQWYGRDNPENSSWIYTNFCSLELDYSLPSFSSNFFSKLLLFSNLESNRVLKARGSIILFYCFRGDDERTVIRL